MPDAEERETWGEATFRVKDLIFAMGSPDGEFASVKAKKLSGKKLRGQKARRR